MDKFKNFLHILLLFLFVEQIVGPPAVIKKSHNSENEKHNDIETNEIESMLEDEEFKLEYQRYLNEVITTLETDEAFKKKVEGATKDDYDTGKIASELAMVNHHVRSKLDELKRREVERLRELVKEMDAKGKGKMLHPSQYEHLDHHNLDTFEVEDLDKLIKKVSKDLDKISQMRRKEFKQYEMEKQFQDEVKMKNMTDAERNEYKHKLEEMKKKHADHDPVHHPGSKAQFEEVWEKQDHLENQEFNPKTFFYLHDLDGNGYWDINEVNALFIKELDKLYQSGLPEDDMRERQEEMERMREHVFKEMDKNNDNMISFEEYIEETKTKEFNQDEGWETLDKQQLYSQQEYEEFERQRMQQMQHMMDQGYHPGAYHPQGPQDMGYHPQNGMPVQYHPGQQYGYQDMHHGQPQPGYHPNQQMPYHGDQMHGQQQQAYHGNQQMPNHPQQPNYHGNQQAMNNHPPQQGYHGNQPPNQHQSNYPSNNQVNQPQQQQQHQVPNQANHQNLHNGNQQPGVNQVGGNHPNNQGYQSQNNPQNNQNYPAINQVNQQNNPNYQAGNQQNNPNYQAGNQHDNQNYQAGNQVNQQNNQNYQANNQVHQQNNQNYQAGQQNNQGVNNQNQAHQQQQQGYQAQQQGNQPQATQQH